MNTKPLFMALMIFGLAGGAWAFGGPGGGAGDCPMATGGGHGMQGGHGMHGGILRDAYRVDDLTAEQRKQLDALRATQRERMAAGSADREALRQALSEGADAATVRPLAEKQGQQVTEAIMRQAEMRAQVESILTEAQRAQLRDMAGNPGDSARPRGRRGR